MSVSLSSAVRFASMIFVSRATVEGVSFLGPRIVPLSPFRDF